MIANNQFKYLLHQMYIRLALRYAVAYNPHLHGLHQNNAPKCQWSSILKNLQIQLKRRKIQ